MRLEEGRECLTCDYCKNIVFPEKNEDAIRVLDEASELSCPVCATPLGRAILAANPILYCAHCRGSLISATVFATIEESLRAQRGVDAAIPHPPDARELDRRLPCPQCHREMDTHYYAGGGNIVIDDCARCELNWLDGGELRVLVCAPGRAYGAEAG
jgi:Zn-finger nucleic acid-binding protein